MTKMMFECMQASPTSSMEPVRLERHYRLCVVVPSSGGAQPPTVLTFSTTIRQALSLSSSLSKHAYQALWVGADGLSDGSHHPSDPKGDGVAAVPCLSPRCLDRDVFGFQAVDRETRTAVYLAAAVTQVSSSPPPPPLTLVVVCTGGTVAH